MTQIEDLEMRTRILEQGYIKLEQMQLSMLEESRKSAESVRHLSEIMDRFVGTFDRAKGLIIGLLIMMIFQQIGITDVIKIFMAL